MEREASSNRRFNLALGIRKHLVFLVAGKQRLKIAGMCIAESLPHRLLMLDDRGYNLIGLREIIIHMDVLKAF